MSIAPSSDHIRQLTPLLGSLAWLLATCPEDAQRDGTRAVELASALAEQTHYADPYVLDTLAAAYAESGRFDQALATVDAALQLARERGDREIEKTLSARRAVYAAGQAFREP